MFNKTDTTMDILTAADRVITPDERRAFLSSFPQHQGSNVADILYMLDNTDLHLDVIEPMYAEHKDDVPEPKLLGIATLLRIGIVGTSEGVAWPDVEELIGRVRGEQFKAVVLKHICESLPESEWRRFRAMSTRKARISLPGVEPQPQVPPAELVSMAMSLDGITLSEALPSLFMELAVEIGKVASRPVYYVSGKGMYVWALSPEARPVSSVWLTHPAYPPDY